MSEDESRSDYNIPNIDRHEDEQDDDESEEGGEEEEEEEEESSEPILNPTSQVLSVETTPSTLNIQQHQFNIPQAQQFQNFPQQQQQQSTIFTYPEQELIYPSSQYFPTYATQTSPSHQAVQRQSGRRNALMQPIMPRPTSSITTPTTSSTTSDIYRHKKNMENLSISSGLNTIHLKDETNDDEGSSNKKIKLDTNLKGSESRIRDLAIESMNQRVEINDFARQLLITRPDIQQFQITKPTVKQSQERERNKNVFAIRCLFECFNSVHELLPVEPFQSLVLQRAINTVSTNESPSSSMQHSKSRNTFIATPRWVIYSSYTLLCDICNVEYLGQSGIGRLVRVLFPSISTKRLGTRGNSKYHYVGIESKPWIKELTESYELGHLQIQELLIPEPVQEPVPEIPQVAEIVEPSSSPEIHDSIGFFNKVDDPQITNFYTLMSNGDLNGMFEIINTITNTIDLKKFYYNCLIFINPLSYQLGDDYLINNLIFIGLNWLNYCHERQDLIIYDHDSISRFSMGLNNLIKLSRCSLSLSNMLFLYHKEMATNFKILNIGEIINLEIDNVMERFLFINFFKKFEIFLINLPNLFNDDDLEDSIIQYSTLFNRFNRLIMKHFVIFLINEIAKFDNVQDLRILILNFSKIITSINDEILRRNEVGLNFNNWWILNCWFNEWLNFCNEIVQFKKSL